MAIEDKEWLNLSGGEKVVWWEHPTILMYIPRYLAGLLVAVIGISLFSWELWRNFASGSLIYLPLILTVLGVLYIVYAAIHRRSVFYVATNNKVVKKQGIVRRHRDPIYYDKISDVESEESMLERIVSFLVPNQEIGDIYIHTADDSREDLYFGNVSSIEEANQNIHDMISRNLDNRRETEN